MKKSLIAVAALAAVAGAAHAESSVTLYGLLDAGVRYDTNGAKDGAGNASSQTQYINGALNTSRFGIKGTEDLSGGLKANFTLESGLKTSTGAAGATDTLFDRRAAVGLSGEFGAIDLGRNTTFGYDLEAAYVSDPLGGELVNLNNNSSYNVGASKALRANPLANFFGTDTNNDARRDNMVKYAGKFGPVTVGAAYAIGGKSGTDANASVQGMVRYTGHGIDAGASYDVLRDGTNRRQKSFSSGANYTLAGVKATVGYSEINADAGFEPKATIATGSGALSLASWVPGVSSTVTSQPAAQAKIWTVGLCYNFTPSLNVVGAYYNTKLGADGLASNSYDTYIIRARYDLSKRTNVYAAVDYNKANDLTNGQTGVLSGKTDNTGLTVGMQHRF